MESTTGRGYQNLNTGNFKGYGDQETVVSLIRGLQLAFGEDGSEHFIPVNDKSFLAVVGSDVFSDIFSLSKKEFKTFSVLGDRIKQIKCPFVALYGVPRPVPGRRRHNA